MATALSVPTRRRLSSGLWTGASAVCAAGVAIILLLIMAYIISKGIGAISLPYLIHVPRPVGVPGGGVANGIVGTFIIVGVAAVMAFPVGMFVGVYLGVYGYGWYAEALAYIADVLAGVPSIAVGIYAYTVLVEPFHEFSAFSASFAFAVLMLPLVIRATEGAIKIVPRELREAATALGAADHRVVGKILLVAARPGIITGLILALARVTGETAPLLFTAFGSQFWELDPTRPMAELSLQIFTYAISPYSEWHEQAWGGALLLILAVFVLSLVARLSFMLRKGGGSGQAE